MSLRGVVCLVVLAFVEVFVNVHSASALALQVERKSVVATEVTRGGSAVFFSVGYDPSPVPQKRRQATIVRDEDGDGVVELAMPEGVPPLGIWAVVDMATGAVQLGSPRGYDLSYFLDPVEASFKTDGDGRFVRLERDTDDLELLIVRPGKGAWTLRGVDGAETDADYNTNATVALSFDKLTPLGEHAAMSAGVVLPTDVVVLIDVTDMRVFAGKLAVDR